MPGEQVLPKSSLGCKDYLLLLYIACLVLFITVSNRLFVGFIAAKPEGRKTAIGKPSLFGPFVDRAKCPIQFLVSSVPSPAKVNVAINNIASVINILCLLPYGFRILFSPFHIGLVIGVYYLNRLALTLIISLLTAKTIIMISFILHFNTMSGKYFQIF
jgi:hypothetical protein